VSSTVDITPDAIRRSGAAGGRRVCDFEGRTLVGSFDPTPDTMSHHSQHFGLSIDATYIFGTFRDGDGNPTSLVRRIGCGGDSLGLTLLHSPQPGADFRVDPSVAARAFIGRAQQDIDSERVRFTGGKAYPHGDRGFELTCTSAELHWSEAVDVELRGERIGPGLQFFTPWSSGAVLYTSRLWQVQGTIRGREVNGFMGVDNVLTPSGYSWGHEPISDNYELSWYTWGNQYDDGTVETGHIASGHGFWGFAIFNERDGELCRTTDVRSLVRQRDEVGWPLHITYRIGDEDWEWVADERGRMVDMGLPGQRRTPNSEGQFRRVGERRSITSWMAWGETVPENGDQRRPAPPV
jgi:hypothetical protein